MDLTKIGNNIKKIRKSKKLTQSQLAEMADISTVHMSHIETGSVAMSLDCLLNICNSLDTTPNAILLGEYNISESQAEVFLKELKLTRDENSFLAQIASILSEMKINRK